MWFGGSARQRLLQNPASCVMKTKHKLVIMDTIVPSNYSTVLPAIMPVSKRASVVLAVLDVVGVM